MKLIDLHMNNFGKFHDCSICFEDGLNVIYGKNEAGKSTLHSFIRGMLFGMERQREGQPGRISSANTVHGILREIMREGFVWNPGVIFIVLSVIFKMFGNFQLLMKLWERNWNRRRR